MKNNTTKSVILAPFNSTRSHISENFFKRDSIQEILVSNSAMMFEDRCREVNRQYMLNNNAELDNGVYNEDEEAKKKDEAKSAAKAAKAAVKAKEKEAKAVTKEQVKAGATPGKVYTAKLRLPLQFPKLRNPSTRKKA